MKSAVPGYQNGLSLGFAECRAYRCTHAKAHRAQSARGYQRTRSFKIIVLRRPHLILTDIGHYIRFALRQLAQSVQNRVRSIGLRARDLPFELGYLAEPLGVLTGRQHNT